MKRKTGRKTGFAAGGLSCHLEVGASVEGL